jgi:hypothetical protein
MPFKNIEIDTESRDWVGEYADMFDGQPISYYLADIIGSSVTTATRFHFNFPKLIKIYKFTISWNNDGFDEHDIERLQKVHSIRRDNKKGQSVRGRGLRCVIENFYKGIYDIQSEDDVEKCTRFLSRSKYYKNGQITAIVFGPNMQIDIRPATPEEREKYKTHMKEKHNIKNNNHGIMGEFRVNTDKAYEIFTPATINFTKKKPEVRPQIIKNIQLILNRRLVNEDGSSGDVSLFINEKEYRPSVRFIHSHPKQRYICLRATIGTRRLGTRQRTTCLRLTNESLERIQQLREENGEMRHLEDIKRYINFHSGGGTGQARKNCLKRKYLDGQDGWMLDDVKGFEPETIYIGNGIHKEKELELRFSVGPPPEEGRNRDGEYLKITSSSNDGACGIFMYHNNTIVNLRGIGKIWGLSTVNPIMFRDSRSIFTNKQIPCVEIEEMNIALGDSKIFTTKAVKADSVQFKANTNFYIALSEFINCFLKRHMYFRNFSEEEVEAEKQKKEQAAQAKEMSESEEESEEPISLPPICQNIKSGEESLSSASSEEEIVKEVGTTLEHMEQVSPPEPIINEPKEEIVEPIEISLEQKEAQEEVQNEIIQTSQQKRVKNRITASNKGWIAGQQEWKCNNSPSGPVYNENTTTGLEDYKCPFWKYNGGVFDGSGYDIDHIDQDTGNIHRPNLQALCPCCHTYKTRKNQRKPLPKDEKLKFIE